MKKLLIICKDQFGGLVDAMKWCQYLRDDYHIRYVGYSGISNHKITMEGVKQSTVSARLPRSLRGSMFLLLAAFRILLHRGPVMVVFFPKCLSLKKFFPRRKMLLDIRTFAVTGTPESRERLDAEIIDTANRFDMVSAISPGVAKRLNRQDVNILPLGADRFSTPRKCYTDGIRLLYVGTLSNRDIHKTIHGLAMFISHNPGTNIVYDIVGDGSAEDTDLCVKAIEAHGLSGVVHMHGRVPYDGLAPFFEKANVGVSFVPITDYFNEQPPTKTFEYIMNGLYCIATATNSNREVVSPTNGTLIADTPEDFARALELFGKTAPTLDATVISESLPQYLWPNIVNNNLKPILAQLHGAN